MAGDPERRNDPFFDLHRQRGREEFQRLFNAEVRTMGDTSSEGRTYRKIRRAAVNFLLNHYRDEQFDALIPYMAMTLVDRVCLRGRIPIVLKKPLYEQNTLLFFTCCFRLSWKLRGKRLDIPYAPNSTGLDIQAQDLIAMEVKICERLDWHLRPVMPFRFLDFFALILTLNPSSSDLQPVYKLIVKSQCDIAFTHFRPSVIAYSAMLVYSSDDPIKLKTLKNSITRCGDFVELQAEIDRCQTMLRPLYKMTDHDPMNSQLGWTIAEAETETAVMNCFCF